MRKWAQESSPTIASARPVHGVHEQVATVHLGYQ